MPNINSDRDNPNQGWGAPNPNVPNYDPNAPVPGQSWGAPNPNAPAPGQSWGAPNPNAPNYDPNAPGQGGNVPNPNMPGYNPNAPAQDRGAQNPNIADQGATSYAAPTGSRFTDPEWKMLMSTPLKVGKAMMFASPTGPIGMVQEAKALSDCIKGLMDRGSQNPLLNELAQNARGVLNSVQSRGGTSALASEYLGGSRDPQVTRTEALTCCQQSSSILRKAAPQDATAYKEFVYNVAQRVAGAAGEGGFLGLGLGAGPKVSPAEQNFLGEIVNALGVQTH